MQLIGQSAGMPHFQQDLSMTGELHSGTERDFKDRQEAAHRVYVYKGFRDYLRRKTGRADLNSMVTNAWHHQGFTLNASGKHPDKGRDGNGKQAPMSDPDIFARWFRASIDGYERVMGNRLNILASTGMVIEAAEIPESKTFMMQWHGEEYGNNGLAIQYWVDTYLNA
jgi:hypothetical protein